MKFQPMTIPEVLYIEPTVYSDERGFFMETYQTNKFEAAGIPQFVQDNHSGSKQGILRGLHYQLCRPQGKLVRVITGEVFDVAVDLRRSSPTFGEWVGAYLSAENKCQLWVPAGFAHGFYVVSEWAEVAYKTTEFYTPHHERAICWNDPILAIQWPLPSDRSPMLSVKDAEAQYFRSAEMFE